MKIPRCSPRLLSTSLLVGLMGVAPGLACGGEVREVPAPDAETAAGGPGASSADPGSRAGAGSDGAADGEVLEVTRATPLLPPTRDYDEKALEAGLLPTGVGIWFSHLEPRQKRSVDRHIKGFELVAQSYGSKFRDSRRSAVLRVVAGDEWASPLVKVPKRGRLTFSYMPYLPGMGGYLFGLEWRVAFEVLGAGDRATRVPLWSKSHVLRPPSGGTWREAEVALAELAGRTGRFVFSVVPTPDSPEVMPFDLVGAFANPTVVPGKDERPNLLVISIDTLRKDAISPYGADPERTPNLQRLADSGVVADQFWSTAPWTLPAYASLFTAEYPSTHGAGAVREGDDGGDSDPEFQGTVGVATGIPNLVEHVREQGYRTQSFYANGHLNLRSGIERGFDGYVWYGMTGETAVEAFHDWTATMDGQPFFAFVQMTDPHWPYVVPRRFARKIDMPDVRENDSLHGQPMSLFRGGVPEEDREGFIEIYERLVSYMDAHVGQILATLDKRGLTENTLVVFHTDHGEELFDRGEWWHGHTHHHELENVALMFSWPGVLPEGVRFTEQFRGIDVLPTALDLIGLPPAPHETEGVSLAGFVRGEGGEVPAPALQEGELYGPGGDYALTSYPWRLLVQPMERWIDREAWTADPEGMKGQVRVMLFNIEEDPLELNDVSAEHPDVVEGMRKRAQGLIARARERKQGESLPAEMGRHADADALEALGYVGED